MSKPLDPEYMARARREKIFVFTPDGDVRLCLAAEPDGTFSEFNELGPAVGRWDRYGNPLGLEFIYVSHLPPERRANAKLYKGKCRPFF